MSFKPSSSTGATISSKDIPRPTFSRSFLSGSHRNGFTEASYQQVCLCHHPCTTMTTSNVAKFPTKRCRGGGLFRPTLVHSLFKTYSLRRVGAVDKAGFVQLAHDARVDHFFGPACESDRAVDRGRNVRARKVPPSSRCHQC